MNIPIKYLSIGLILTIGFSYPAHVSALEQPFTEVGVPITHIKLIEPIQTVPISQAQEVTPEPVTPVVQAPVASTRSYAQPDNYYKAFIYSHESGNDPSKYNSSGCLGLGQACPASKLLASCPNMDYACEDAWFSNYAISVYGSWEGAYSAWQSKGWW